MLTRSRALFGLVAALGLVACDRGADPTAPDGADLPLTTASAGPGAAIASGAVLTASNAAAGNELWLYSVGSDGGLSFEGAFATGGLGTGAGLGNQGGMHLSANHRRLLVVNAGSNDVSAFDLRGAEPTRTDLEPSGGVRPVSVTQHGSLVYVLNAGSPENVSGFRLDEDGRLTPIPGSTRALSAPSVGAAQVSFSPDGRTLVVTEKATNRLVSFPVLPDGTLGSASVIDSPGQTPFGFAFDARGNLFVSEAFGGAAGASTLSSYRVVSAATLEVVSAAVPTGETAACWVVVTPNSRFAYVTNAGTGTVSSYAISPSGAAQLHASAAALTGAGPIDMALNRGGRYLYVLNSGSHEITSHRVGPQGSLSTFPGGVAGLPAGANGLVAF
ncbi:MAG: beta-propeller fold lactonase family protein [Gemmatimonadota bacterium]